MALLRDWSIRCIPGDVLNDDERKTLSAIYITTSTFGLAGAAVQLRHLWKYRNAVRRSPSAHHNIIFFLALSDLITCLGMIALAVMLLIIQKPIKVNDNTYKPKKFISLDAICTVMEIVTLMAVIASAIWTLNFAIDVCLQIYKIHCPMVVYHILAWLIPMNFVGVIESISWGYWPVICDEPHGIESRLIVSYIPVLIVFVVNPLLFVATYKKVRRRLKGTGIFSYDERLALKIVARRYLVIMGTYALCWFPNVISILYYWTMHHGEMRSSFLIFWYVEAVLNPLHGLFNCFVYRNTFKVIPRDIMKEPKFIQAPLNFNEIISPFQHLCSKNLVQNKRRSYNSFQKSPSSLKNPQAFNYKSRLFGECCHS
ncbi:G-protein coupled receptor 143-like [Xenia sp. Carnegie-2017]|uniref:G-protein coupled receptor 143-like n=1 Tax=Xenia sp. Carnegie-2017 TaxID=2897299 RepID=UPI001F04509D|nr:G-protein coupled receptor 143-like [Xenia sp. Carnegie-2017]XP_046861159.1 G-protein coupled receptor 143-like [Xenia sp. Carnegie-2017]